MATQQQSNGQTTALQLYARHGEQLNLAPFMDSNKFNLLSPVQVVKPLSPFHMVGVTKVQLSPDPNKGDVYADGKNLRPSKIGLFKLSAAAGIQWFTPECKMLYRDDRRVVFQAVGFLVGPDGRPTPIKGTKEIDLGVIEEESRIQHEEKIGGEKITGWKDGPGGKRIPVREPWASEEERQRAIDLAVRKEVLQKRRNMVALAETGAYLRAIRAVLALKSNYTPEELAKPFVMVRTYLDPEADMEMAKEMVRINTMMSMQAPAAIPAQPVAGMIEAPTFDVSAIPEAADEEPADTEVDVYEGEIPDEESVPADRLI